MNLIDFIKQRLSKLTAHDLPYRHRNACLGLVLTLVILLMVPDSESIVPEPEH